MPHMRRHVPEGREDACGRLRVGRGGPAGIAGTSTARSRERSPHSKAPFPTWADFIMLMLYTLPLDLAAEICEVSRQTALEMRHRVFATVDGRQDRIVLRDRVWIDETYIADVSLVKGPDWRPMRGLSRQKVCIAVAIDACKDVVAVVYGGEPSAKRIKGVLKDRVAEGATIVHDKEKAHNSLVKTVKGVSEACKAGTKDPAYLEGVKLVNSLCSWMQRYLGRFAGMKRENLQPCLNWFAYAFRVKRDKGRWPETARVVRHLLMSDSSYRSFRAPKVPHALLTLEKRKRSEQLLSDKSSCWLFLGRLSSLYTSCAACRSWGASLWTDELGRITRDCGCKRYLNGVGSSLNYSNGDRVGTFRRALQAPDEN